MDSPSFEGPRAGSLSAEMRTEILQELVEIGSTVANAQIEGLTARLADALLRVSTACIDADEAKLHLDAANLLRKNRYPFFYVASSRLTVALENEMRALESAFPTQDRSDAAAPTLPPDVEIDKKLCLIKAGRAIEGEHAERLNALGIRLARLLGRDQLPVAQNPFRPLVFLSVMHDAWCEFHPDSAAHHLLFPLLQPTLCLDMAPILHALNSALIKRGIVPTLSESLHVEIVASAKAALPQQEPAGDALAQHLRRLFPTGEPAQAKSSDRPLAGAFPTLFQDDVMQAATSRNALLDYLSNIQKPEPDPRSAVVGASAPQYTSLGEIQRHAPLGSLSPADDNTFALVTRVFDAILADQNIPAEMKELIGLLQVPALKAALIDKNFFFKESYPARRSIDLLAKLSIGWDHKKGLNDPLYLIIQRSVKRIQQEADHRIAVFADVVANLEGFIKREETAAAQTLAPRISHALQQEKLQQATKAAKHEVALRVGTGEVVAFVETFLEDKWVPVLTLAYSVKEEKPQAVESALKTMDALCWSVKPKITMAERKDLLAKLPPMLAMLNKWLDLIKWDDAERTRFFAELARCHASIVRAPLELSPERQLQIAMQVAKKAAERRLQRQASQPPDVLPDEFDQQVGTLERGTWVEFARQNGAPMKVTLAWVSPMRSLYIFATRERQEALSISAEELARALRTQRAHIVPAAGLVGRALAAALSIGGASNDAALSAA